MFIIAGSTITRRDLAWMRGERALQSLGGR